MDDNYPPGVTNAHPYFNPPTCEACKNETATGQECEYCGEYVNDVYDDMEDHADQMLERVRQEIE